MKRGAFILVFIALLTLAWPGEIKASLKLFIDDQLVELQYPLQMIDGNFMIPVWVLEQHLGAKGNVTSTGEKIELIFFDQTIHMQLGQESAQVGNKKYMLDVAPQVVQGELLLPIRFLADRLNLSLNFVPDLMGLVLETSKSLEKGVVTKEPDTGGTEPLVQEQSTEQDLREILFMGGPRSRVFLDLQSYTGYQTNLLTNPDRLVIDFFGISGDPLPVLAVDDPIVLQVRSSRFDKDIMRVVFDLKAPTGYQVSPWPDGGLEVEFNYRLSSVNIREKGDMAQLHFTSTDLPVLDFVYLNDPPRLVIDFQNTTLVGNPINREINLERIGRLRVNQHQPSVTRVVLELKAPIAPLSVIDKGNGDFVLPLFAGVPQEAEDYLTQITNSKKEEPGENNHTEVLEPIREGVLSGLIIAVDPGHGGSDPGTIGYQGTFEKDVTLAISKYLGEFLTEAGADVVYTREQDIYVSIFERPQIAVQAGAHLFVSIHVNSHLQRGTARGTETLYRANDPISQELARSVQAELVKAITLVDRRIWGRDDLAVFNGSKIPAVLVEVGFLDHQDEEVLLRAPGFQKVAAEGIYKGIKRFYLETLK